jgi:hypothetical protein
MSDLESFKQPRSTNGIGNANIGDVGDIGSGNTSIGNASTGGVGNDGVGNGNVGANGGAGTTPVGANGNAGNGNAGGAAPALVDAFSDLSKLRMDQSYADIVGVKKVLMTVPVRKPSAQERVRVHPEFRLPGAPIIELKDDRESFLVTPAVAAQLSPGDFALKDLFLTLSRQNVLFVWPVPVPTEGGGRGNAWHTSAREAAILATTKWIRLSSNMALRAYDVTESSPLIKIPEPEWPTDKTFADILRIAFKDRLIETVDHPVIQRLLLGA